MADRIGSVILGNAHFNKTTGTECEPYGRVTCRASIFGFAGDETDGSRVMTQVKNPHGRDDLPSLGYKIETTQPHAGAATVSARAGQHGGARDHRLSVPMT
jgi:hypothetical protein